MSKALQTTVLFFALLALGGQPAVARPGPSAPRLKQVTVKGKPYYATYRVCSARRGQSLMDSSNKLRWSPSNSVWQYGSGFYLFGNLKDAKKFIRCSREGMSHLLIKNPRTPIKARETILEVLIPKERYDRAAKAEVKRGLDWATDSSHPKYQQREQLRRDNTILFGRWQEDPTLPFAAYKPMVGTSQLAVVKTGADSLLNSSLVRMISPGPEASSNKKLTPRPRKSRAPPFKPARGLTGPARIKAVVAHNRSQHTELHRVLAGRTDRHQGKKALDYLINKFPTARAYLPRESGTWEGFTVKGHTLRAYNVLGSQLRHVDVKGIARSYPGVNVERTLKLALLLHDVGKPVAIDRARGLIDQTLAAGRSLEALDRGKLKHHARYSSSMMTRIMWQLGSNTNEIRLARALVSCDALGHLEQGKINMTGARDQLKKAAGRARMKPADYFKLQSLFYTADAGSYRYLRRSIFERSKEGRMKPTSIGYQMLEMQLN
jgi:hypothetical protein